MAPHNILLQNKGEADRFLTENPETTPFATEQLRITNFVVQHNKVSITGFDYGATCNVDIAPAGDCIRNIYWHFVVAPLDTTATDYSSSSRFVNMFPYALLKKIELKVGHDTVDKATGVQWGVMEEQSGGALEMGYVVGKSGSVSELRSWAQYQQEFFVPSKFWMNVNSGQKKADQVYPIIATRNNPLRLDIETRTFPELIVDVSNASSKTASASQGGFVSADVIVEYIYLERPEQDVWLNASHRFTHDTWQSYTFQNNNSLTNGANFEYKSGDLPFQKPLKELVIVVQPLSRSTTVGANDFFDFSAPSTGTDNPQKHPIVTLSPSFNNESFSYVQSSSFMHVITHRAYHSSIPKRHIYSICSALDPEDSVNLSGSWNVGRIEHVTLSFVMHGSMTGTSLYQVFARLHTTSVLESGYMETLA